MEITKMSTKGQVVLPKAIREARHWNAGTEFVVEETPGGVLLRPLGVPATRFEDVAGCLRYAGRPKTLKEMEDAISTELKERRDRGRY
jgi:AbrB family looped-hinge helix DNA binding protein